jgi:hypothetical protein
MCVCVCGGGGGIRHVQRVLARHNNPRNGHAVRIRSSEVCGSPRCLSAREDGRRARVEVENDKVNETNVDRVPLGRSARCYSVRRGAVEGAAGDEVPERCCCGRPRRARIDFRSVLAKDDTPRLVEVALLCRQINAVSAVSHCAFVVADHGEPQTSGEDVLEGLHVRVAVEIVPVSHVVRLQCPWRSVSEVT